MSQVNRKFINPEDVLGNPEDAFELWLQTIRSAMPFSTLNNPGYRKAQVLEGAQELSATDAAAFGMGPTSNRMSNYRYIVRLAGEWNEHMLIPDPCNPATSTSRNADFAESHLIVLGAHDTAHGTTLSINRGDFCDIDMEKGNFANNLQKAQHAGMASRPQNPESSTCTESTAMARLFGSMTAGPAISPSQAAFEAALKRDSGMNFKVSSYTRTPQEQIKAMVQHCTIAELAKYTGGKLESAANELIKFHRTKDETQRMLHLNNAITQAEAILPADRTGHMSGRAIDIGTKTMSEAEVDKLRKVTKELGGYVNLEPVTGKCWNQPGTKHVAEYGKGTLKRLPPTGATKPTPGKNNCKSEHLHISWATNWKDPKSTA